MFCFPESEMIFHPIETGLILRHLQNHETFEELKFKERLFIRNLAILVLKNFFN